MGTRVSTKTAACRKAGEKAGASAGGAAGLFWHSNPKQGRGVIGGVGVDTALSKSADAKFTCIRKWSPQAAIALFFPLKKLNPTTTTTHSCVTVTRLGKRQ